MWYFLLKCTLIIVAIFLLALRKQYSMVGSHYAIITSQILSKYVCPYHFTIIFRYLCILFRIFLSYNKFTIWFVFLCHFRSTPQYCWNYAKVYIKNTTLTFFKSSISCYTFVPLTHLQNGSSSDNSLRNLWFVQKA